MFKNILLSVIICAVPLSFVALMLSSAYHRIVQMRRRCRAAAMRLPEALAARDARLGPTGGGDVASKELKAAVEHLLQEPANSVLAEAVSRCVQNDSVALAQMLQPSASAGGTSTSLDALRAAQTELETAARLGVDAARAFETGSRRFPAMIFASAGRGL